MLESQYIQIPESSQTPGNEFFGFQTENWANCPILQTEKLKLREKDFTHSQGPGNPGHLRTGTQEARTYRASLDPLNLKTSRPNSHAPPSLLLGKQVGGGQIVLWVKFFIQCSNLQPTPSGLTLVLFSTLSVQVW